jgi:nucleoside-diphosphate-sugar epimerase
MTKRVLVTGGAGFVGSRTIAPLLARGFEVHVAERSGRTVAGATVHVVDLTDPVASAALVERARPSHLLHAAWFTQHGVYWSAPENLTWLRASLALLESFQRSGGRRFVGVGTCAEYAWGVRGALREEAELRPDTLYGAAKSALGGVLSQFARSVSLSWGWARLFFLYGPGEHPSRIVASVARDLVAGRRVELSDGRQLRDFMHVDDAGAALAALLDSDVQGAVNVASGDAVSIGDLARRLAALDGRGAELAFGARPRRDGEPEEIVADVGRLEREVGFRSAVDLEHGLADALRWWGRVGASA